MNVEEAAKRLGCHPATVRYLLKQRKLRGKRKSSYHPWEIEAQSVREYAKVKHSRGWPRGKSRSNGR